MDLGKLLLEDARYTPINEKVDLSVFDSSITQLQHSPQQILSWMTANLLTRNSSKTEFLLIGLPQQLAKINTPHWLLLTLLVTLVLSSMNI